MIHIMLGTPFEEIVRLLTGYVHSYDDQTIASYFSSLLCTWTADSISFKETRRFAVTDGESARFNPDPDDEFRIDFDSNVKVFKGEQRDLYLQSFFTDLFDSHVTINSELRSTSLKVNIYLPMYDQEAWGIAKELLKAVDNQTRSIEVNIFFLAADLAGLLTPAGQSDELPRLRPIYMQNAKATLQEAVSLKENGPFVRSFGHIIVMQNCNADGVSLELDRSSFVRILGEFAIASMNSYNDIFNGNMEVAGRPIHAFGLCVLNLDKFYYIKYLLNKAYLTILEREGINRTKVDVNMSSQVAQSVLLGDDERYKFYKHFHEKRVKGYIAVGMTEEQASSSASKEIDEEIDILVSRLLAFINDDNLSIPEKRVTLAQLLGMDDELMSGDIFDSGQLIFRDTYADCIGMFVLANNALLAQSSEHLYVEIPHGNTKPVEERVYPEELKNYAALGEEELDFEALRRALKNQEVQIRRQTEFIRTLEHDLEVCHIQEKRSEEKDKVLTVDGFRFGEQVFKLIPSEVIPLENTYQPRSVSALPKSLDLRSSFTAIKNQGEIGSCVAYAFTSIYEYILNSNRIFDADLSELYLYYNARVAGQERKGMAASDLSDSGTSFYDAVNALQKDGLCREDLWKYQAERLNERPSDEAFADGHTRLVTEAKNVELKEEDIKSALNEGYPVAVSLRLFPSFQNLNHGIVPFPSPDEINVEQSEEMHENHAMVICGYNDEDKLFVVRNSWGIEFGDKGYCYIPYSYITDGRTSNQACIITGVNLLDGKQVKGTSHHEVVSFDRLNPEINAAIIQNLIGEAHAEKNRQMQRRNALFSQYTLLENKLRNSQVRSTLMEGTIQRLQWEISELESQKQENSRVRGERLKTLDQMNMRVNFYGIAALIVVVIFLLVSFHNDLIWLIFSALKITKIFKLVILGAIIAVGYWWLSYLKTRKEIQEEHAEISARLDKMIYDRTEGKAGEAGYLGLHTQSIRLRMYMPWLVFRKLSEKNRELEQLYQTMVSYNRNLLEWYESEKLRSGKMAITSNPPFISLLSNETLDKYYKANAERITKTCNMSTLFQQGYELNEESIVKFQHDMKKKIIALLEKDLSDFTVYKYLLGQTRFEFADDPQYDINTMLRRLEEKSLPFLRLRDVALTHEVLNSRSQVLMSCDIMNNLSQWDQLARNFTSKVFHLRITSPFKLSFLQMNRYALDECLDVYDRAQSPLPGNEKNTTEMKEEDMI